MALLTHLDIKQRASSAGRQHILFDFTVKLLVTRLLLITCLVSLASQVDGAAHSPGYQAARRWHGT
jgi:hypothetical protein